MEFPELGSNCSIESCKQLDFLPVKCDACQKTFCKDHFAYVEHQCSESYKKDKQVPICPLCNAPVTIKQGQTPDEVVGRHIDNDCQSDVAIHKRKVYSNRCSKKACKTKELIPFRCESCRKNYCVKHRLEADHNCQGYQGSGRSVSSAGAAALARNSASSSGVQSKSSVPKSKPQQSKLTSIGRDLDRERRERERNPPQPRNLRSMQSGMTEEEAMAQAISMSLGENRSELPQTEEQKEQEEADLAFARALQESEQAVHNSQLSQRNTRPQAADKQKSCIVS